MKVEIGDVLSLSNSNKYAVISKTTIERIDYLFLININNHNDIRYVYVENDSVNKVKDEELLEKLKLIFLDNTLNYLKENQK